MSDSQFSQSKLSSTENSHASDSSSGHGEVNSSTTSKPSSQNLWKSIEHNKISHSVAHYLMAIDTIVKELHYCKASDIARRLQISRNAVSLRLNPLVQMDLIHIDASKKIYLSDSGQRVVNNIISSRRVTKKFLTNFLNIDDQVAEEDSCKIEHLISDQMRIGLLSLMQFTQEQAHISAPFLQALQEFTLHCDGKAQPCSLCHSQCLIHDQQP